jgi:hypothetical protein
MTRRAEPPIGANLPPDSARRSSRDPGVQKPGSPWGTRWPIERRSREIRRRRRQIGCRTRRLGSRDDASGSGANGSSAERTRRAPEPTFRLLKPADESARRASSTPTRAAGRPSRRVDCRRCRTTRGASDSSSEGCWATAPAGGGDRRAHASGRRAAGCIAERTARRSGWPTRAPSRRFAGRGNGPVPRATISRPQQRPPRPEHARHRPEQAASHPCERGV